jgi:DNA-binding LacI/PurR family transcriptional regulator
METAKAKSLTMQDVAQKSGVSITTVSHVINKTRHVSQETKDAVLKAIRELNYQASRIRKPDADKSVLFIGVILADAREDYYIEMLKVLELVAADYDLSIIISDSEADSSKEEKNNELLLERNESGIHLAPVNANLVPALLKSMTIPIVLIDRQFNAHKFLFVGINNFQSSYHGTRYLLDHGCKRIGFIGYGGSVYTVEQRSLGYSASLMEFNQGFSPKQLSLSYSREDSFPLIKRFIIDEELDGLVCATSSICYEVIDVLEHLDAVIQKRLKIISYDDNRWLDFLKYPVSVISQPVAEIGSAALESLLQMIEQPDSIRDLKRELLFETIIIER